MVKSIRTICTLFVSLALLSAVPAVGQAASLKDPVVLKIAAQAPGLSFYSYASTLSKLLEKHGPPGSKVEAFPRGGAMSNPTTLDQGRCELAFAQELTSMWAWNGLEDVYGTYGKHKNIRFLTPGLMSKTYFTAIARRDYVEKTGQDTLEKMLLAKDPPRFIMKPQGSMAIPLFKGYVASVGKNFDDLKKAGKVLQVPQSQFSEMLRDSRADVYIDNVPLGHPGVTEILMTNDLVWVNLPEKMLTYMAENLDAVPTKMPKGGYQGVAEDWPTTGDGQNLIIHKDVPDDVAYFLAKLLVEKSDVFVEENGSLKGWDPTTMHETLQRAMPVHPGAAQYYKERGWM